MAKVRINKIPEGYKLINGKLIKIKSMGGALRSGDQKNFGLVSHPETHTVPVSTTSHFNPFSEVNNTLKSVPRDEATIEAEGGETVLTDLNEDGKFEFYKIVGPRHSGGGVPLNVPPQSFIYSDTREMKFNQDEMLEMGIESKKKLTPAAISKNFELNKFIGMMDDVTSDKIAIDTAEYMTDKNKKKLSQLAFVQEAKKGFEEGVPLAAYPYLKEQGIDPIKYTQEIEGINEQEAKAKALAQMPLGQREQIMEIERALKSVQQQDFQQAQQAEQMAIQGPAPQGMPMPPQQQMMPPQQQMMPPQGMMPPQQEMAAPPIGMPMQPPMAQPAMPAMRYGGHYQGGGEDLSAYQDTLNAHIYQSLPQYRLDQNDYSWKEVLKKAGDKLSALVLDEDPELKLKDTINTLEQSNIILNNPSLAVESFERAMEKLGIQTFKEKPEGMTDDEFTMLKAQQFFNYYGIDPNNLSGAVRQGLIDHFAGEEKRYGGDLSEAQFGYFTDKFNQAKDAYKDSNLYKTGQKALNYTQDALSVAGTVPLFGAVADVANTAISGARVAGSAGLGDKEATKKNAKDLAWNAAAIVPGAGQAATAAKFANRGIKAINKRNQLTGAVNLAGDIKDEVTSAPGSISDTLSAPGQMVDSPIPSPDPIAEKKKQAVAQHGGDPYSLDDIATQDEREAILHNAGIGEIYTLGTDELGDVPRMNLPPAGSMKKRFLRSLDALDGYVGEKSGFNPDGPDIGYYGPLTAKGLSAEHKGNIPEDEIPYGVFKMNPYESMLRKKTGGDPFAPNPLRDFIYGGIAQDGKELPDGMSKEQVAAAENAGMTWDPETKTWSHPTHDQSYVNSLITDIKSDHSISGVSEGIGEEGIPGMQQKGTTEAGTTSYQGVSDAQIKKWQEANKYIIDGIKDENGNPMFTEENPFVPTPANVKLVQQGKNDYLDRALEADPSIKENFLDADGNFDQEAYYKANHGYYGDGAQAIDGKLGEYTVTDQGITPPEKEDAPVVEVEGCDKEKVAAECAEKGLPFVEDACNCGIAQEEVETQVDEPRPEFWLQDQIKYTDLVRQKLGLRKYRPWAATFSPETIDATYVDPTRAIAAVQEGAKTAGDSTAYAGAAANRAMKLKAQGQAAKSVADIWAQNQEANLQSEMQTNKINTLIKNEAEEKNLAIHNQLHTDNIAVDKEYDNALRDINNKLANQLANSYTNMANTHNLNSLYPQFNIKPGTGGLVEFTNPQELFAEKNVDSRTKEERLSDVMQTLKQNQVDPKSLPKDVWSDLLASDSPSGNSELDEVKDAITSGGYGDNAQTGVLGGYPGTNQEVTRYGGENKKRIAMKGKELRKWFSPLQRGLAD